MAPRLHTQLMTGTAILLCAALGASAAPMGGTVVGGSATISTPSASSLIINQTSQNAIINWNSFNIGAGQTVQFIQPSSSSIVLDRVIGGLGPSTINGTLTANGNVFLINPYGVLIGRGGVINTGGFLATTSDINNSDFMAGRYNFTTPGQPNASIVNLGRITAANSGFAALVAPGVRNSGTITATLGTVALASGNTFTLDLYGDKLIQLAPGDSIASQVIDVATGKPLSALVSNSGTIKANGGQIQLTAVAARQVVNSVINNTGVLEANTVGTRAGKIVLGAATASTKPAGAPTQTVKLSGTVSASGKGTGGAGGTVVVTGENIQVTGATINASGDTGGGKVLIGGDWGGGNPATLVSNPSAQLETYAIPTATTVSVDAGTTINASALVSGNGGKVILWSDNATTFAGTILAGSSAPGGIGGFVETSSKDQLNFTGQVNTLAPNGTAGTLLLDPADYYVTTGTVPAGASSITPTALESQLANGNVIIATNNLTNPAGQNGDIFVNAGVSWSSGYSLTLDAAHAIAINAPITISGPGGLVMSAAYDPVLTTLPLITFGTGGSVQFTGTPNTGQSLTINDQSYTLLYSMSDVQNINSTGFYALAKPLDASNVESWTPIGPSYNPFTGTFNGLGNTISNLTISAPAYADSNIGLFGVIGPGGVVQNLALSNFNVSATSNGQFIGTLAGQNAGTISNVTASGGSVNGGSFQSITAGGLIAQNGMYNELLPLPGTISNSTASVAVTVGGCTTDCAGINVAGGLAGNNVAGSTISNSSASGPISGGSNSVIGGLVGQNGFLSYDVDNDNDNDGPIVSSGSISGSFATGTVTSNGINVALGGLVGINQSGSLITTSYASGAVTDTAATNSGPNCGNSCSFVKAGGLVGQNYGTIGTAGGSLPAVGTACGAGFTCASGAVSVGNGASGGGLTGDNSGVIQFAFATGNVVGGSGGSNGSNINVGGLTGNNKVNGLITNTWASGSVSAGSAALAGGLVGADDGQVMNSTATGAVTAADNSIIGGLLGGMSAQGSVSSSSATGAVTATGANTMAGGLIGGSFGLVTLSSASGNVTGISNSYLGGLIGANGGTITQSFATGKVTGSGSGNYAGGLTGANFAWPLPVSTSSVVANLTAIATAIPPSTGTIAQSYATGAVSSGANSYVGGLAGASLALTDGTTSFIPSITQSYATGAASGGANSVVAGLVALNTGTIDQTYAVGRVTGGAGSVLGGLVAQNSLSSTPPLPAYPSPLQSCDRCGNFVSNVPLVPGTGTVTNSYWDFETTGQLSSAAGVSQTSAQLTSALPAGFDSTVWTIQPGTTLPYLGAPVPVPTPLPVPGPPVISLTPPGITPQPQFVAQLTNPGITTPSTGQVVDTAQLTQQQQQQQQQQQGRQGQQQQQGRGGLLPGQLDAGPGRFFFVPVGDNFVFNEGVLQLDSSIPLAQLQQIGAELGFTVVSSQPIGLLGQTAYRIEITNGKSVAMVIGELVSYQIVTGAAPQYRFFLTQDAASQEGDPGQYVLEKLRLPDVHRALRGDNVEIAVIDSQIDAAHPDLAGDITSSYDAAGVEEKPHPHGTGMAGAIIAHQRLMGVAPNAHVLAIHAFSTKAASPESTTFSILKGLDYAVAHNVRLVNMSFAGPRDPTLERAIKAAYDKNVIMIAAAGNAGPKSPPLYPGADPNVIAVTATDMDDKLFSGANRGKYVAIAAPGVDILVPAPDGTYQLTTGTSVATAHITGIVALMLERNPKLTPADVRRILTASAKRLGPNDQFGAGLVDPAKALQLAAPRSAELGLRH